MRLWMGNSKRVVTSYIYSHITLTLYIHLSKASINLRGMLKELLVLIQLFDGWKVLGFRLTLMWTIVDID